MYNKRALHKTINTKKKQQKTNLVSIKCCLKFFNIPNNKKTHFLNFHFCCRKKYKPFSIFDYIKIQGGPES